MILWFLLFWPFLVRRESLKQRLERQGFRAEEWAGRELFVRPDGMGVMGFGTLKDNIEALVARAKAEVESNAPQPH